MITNPIQDEPIERDVPADVGMPTPRKQSFALVKGFFLVAVILVAGGVVALSQTALRQSQETRSDAATPTSFIQTYSRSFESGNFSDWSLHGLDTTESSIVNCSAPPSTPCSDGQHYAKLVRNLSNNDSHLASDWIETGQNLSEKQVRVSFAIKAHNANATIKGIMLQREPIGTNWGQATRTLPDIQATSNWKTETHTYTFPFPDDGNTSTRFRIVLRPEMDLDYQLPVYYDNIKLEVWLSLTQSDLTLSASTLQTNGNVVLRWNDVGAGRYDLFRCANNNNDCTPMRFRTQQSIGYTDSQSWSTDYKRYQVQAFPDTTSSTPSLVSNVVVVEAPTTVTPPISPPISMQPGFTFNAALQAGGEVKLDWTFIDTASKNVVQSCSSSASNSDVNNCTFTQLADKGLANSHIDNRKWGTTKFKYYKVIVYGQSPSDGNLGVLHTSNIKTVAAPIPPDLTLETPELLSGNKVKLIWNSIVGATKYQVFSCTNTYTSTTNCTPTKSTDLGNVTTYTDSPNWGTWGTVKNKHYFIKALGSNNTILATSNSRIVNAPPSPTITSTPTPTPTGVADPDLTVILRDNGDVMLTWAPMGAVPNRQIHACNGRNCSPTLLANNIAGDAYIDDRPWGTTTYRRYQIKITGPGDVGTVLAKSTIKRIAAPTSPPPPQSITLNPPTVQASGNVNLSWSAVSGSGLSAYQILACHNINCTSNNVIKSTDALQYTDTSEWGDASQKRYQIKVTVNGSSIVSNVVTAAKPGTGEPDPTAVPPTAGLTESPTDNLLKNGSFTNNVSSWHYALNNTGSLSADNGTAKIKISSPGSNMQFYQAGVSLQAGARYRLSFKAKSDNGSGITGIQLLKHTSPYDIYASISNTPKSLPKNFKEYSYDFTPSGFSGTNSNVRLRFWLVGNAKANDTYWFDDVLLQKVENTSPTLTSEPDPTVAATISPTEPTYMLGDFDQNGVVSLAELQRVMGAYGKTGVIPEDVNNDGEVNLFDVTLVMANFLR